MRKAVLLVGVLLFGACHGGEDGAPKLSAESDDLVIKTVVVGPRRLARSQSPVAKSPRAPLSGARRSALAEPSRTPTEAPTLRCP
jgi:hypothetical protein